MRLSSFVLTMSLLIMVCTPLQASTSNAAQNPEMPTGLWQAFNDARHKIESIDDEQAGKTYRAINHDNNLLMQFGEDGLTVKQSGKDSPWHMTMQLQSYGQQQSPQKVQAATLEVNGRRISYHRGNISEWYINDHKGLEQGFTLNTQPDNYQADQPVFVTLGIKGNVKPRWQQQGQSLDFYDAQQQKAFSYSKLKAFDANGEILPAEMRLEEGQITLEVTVAAATWPITIDPLFYTEIKVTALESDAAPSDLFGVSVALDGDTALIGSQGDNHSGLINPGSAYVFINNGGSWNLEAKLTAPDAASGDRLGGSVALLADTALIGAVSDDSVAVQDSGSAYIFTRTTGTWAFTAKLTASNAAAQDNFGHAVAISPNAALGVDVALIGATGTDQLGVTGAGSAYVFEEPSIGGWVDMNETAELIASDASPDDQFGWSVALDGDLALVGVPYDDHSGANSGSAYVFLRPTFGNWASATETNKLTASDAAAFNFFGFSVALSGTTALIGARTGPAYSGFAYIFETPWTALAETAKLTASDSVSFDQFGFSVDLFGDTALIGANYVDNIYSNSGAAYVFVRPFTGWETTSTFAAKLIASDPADGHYLGGAVALSGDTALVGSTGTDPGGSAYVFDKPPGGWANMNENAVLTAVANQANRRFGYAAAIESDTAVIGAVLDDSGGIDSGAAFVFTRSGDSWLQTAKLTASDAAADDLLGCSVALSGNTALVGACGDDNSSGAAYVFVRPGAGWVSGTESTKLNRPGAPPDYRFGTSVALEGDTALIGAPGYFDSLDVGIAYIYVRPPGGWASFVTGVDSEIATLNPNILPNGALANGDKFGQSVALSGNTALVGSPGDDSAGTNSGAGYVFTKPAGGWVFNLTETAKLTPSDAISDTQFGWSVALSDDTALIGSYLGNGSALASGSAYLFTEPVSGWASATESARLVASDGAVGDWFGRSVALLGDNVLIGAPLDDNPDTASGSAYIFVKPGTGWVNASETAKLAASDAGLAVQYGWSVALSGDTALIGSPFDNAGADDSGSAYFNRFECGLGGSVAQSRWTMFSIPCDLDAFNTVDDVFGDNFNSLDYQSTWVVYKRDEANERYILLGPGSPLEVGEGYWIFSQTGGYWDAGNGNLTTFTQSGNCPSPKGCYEIDLVPPADGSSVRYNMVGHPANIQSDWASVRFLVDGVLYTPFDADFNNFVTNTLWKFNGNGYDSFNDNTPGMIGYLDTYDGFWVQTLGGSFGKAIKMLVPYGTSTGSPPGPPGGGISMLDKQLPLMGLPATEQPLLARFLDFVIPDAHAAKPVWDQEWYLRLIAISEAENLRDANNVLGQLSESVDGPDQHDLRELAGFGTPYLSLSFPMGGTANEADSFASNYHYVDTAAADEWVFEVKSDDPYRDVDLYWDGVYLLEGVMEKSNKRKSWTQSKQMDSGKLYKRMVLEDIDLGVEIDAVKDGTVNHYEFNMEGQTVRTFRWVMKTAKGKRPKQKAVKQSRREFIGDAGVEAMQQVPQPGKRSGQKQLPGDDQ